MGWSMLSLQLRLKRRGGNRNLLTEGKHSVVLGKKKKKGVPALEATHEGGKKRTLWPKSVKARGDRGGSDTLKGEKSTGGKGFMKRPKRFPILRNHLEEKGREGIWEERDVSCAGKTQNRPFVGRSVQDWGGVSMRILACSGGS